MRRRAQYRRTILVVRFQQGARFARCALIFSGLYRNDPAFRLNMQTIQQGVIWLMVGSAIDQIDLTMPQGSSQAALFVLSRASLPGNESPANALDTFERQRIRRAIGGRLFRHVERQHLRGFVSHEAGTLHSGPSIERGSPGTASSGLQPG